MDISVRYGASTHVGHVRFANEDAHLAAAPVFVVADGMGGHHDGALASRIVVSELEQLAGARHDPAGGREAIVAALGRAQDRVHALGVGPRGRRAGTTATIALLVEAPEGPHWLVANLGDSRTYRFARGLLDQVSVDHSVVQELVDAGRIPAEAAATHPDRHVITRAIGGEVSAEADLFEVSLTEARRLLLCSDGINGMLDDQQIGRILATAGDPQQAADQLVAAALEAGGKDNATAVVVDAVDPEQGQS